VVEVINKFESVRALKIDRYYPHFESSSRQLNFFQLVNNSD